MSDLLPLFPLPNVVLFPNVFLPLHVFEPRYRDLVADALAADRMLGMVLLQPGWEHDYEGRPAVYPVGCSGVITHVERLPDGRYNIVLRGLDKFRIVDEDQSRTYRRALAEPLAEPAPTDADRDAIRGCRSRLEVLLAPAIDAADDETGDVDTKIPASMNDEDLINALAQYLDLDAIEKQALLEQRGLRARAESLADLLEMKAMASRHVWTPGRRH